VGLGSKISADQTKIYNLNMLFSVSFQLQFHWNSIQNLMSLDQLYLKNIGQNILSESQISIFKLLLPAVVNLNVLQPPQHFQNSFAHLLDLDISSCPME
jgi:hypothetical protein